MYSAVELVKSQFTTEEWKLINEMNAALDKMAVMHDVLNKTRGTWWALTRYELLSTYRERYVKAYDALVATDIGIDMDGHPFRVIEAEEMQWGEDCPDGRKIS